MEMPGIQEQEELPLDEFFTEEDEIDVMMWEYSRNDPENEHPEDIDFDSYDDWAVADQEIEFVLCEDCSCCNKLDSSSMMVLFFCLTVACVVLGAYFLSMF